MGIRETLNRNPNLTTGVTAGIIVLAIIVIFWQSCAGEGGSSDSGKYFFSTDDGKTFFKDDIAKIPPFDVGGKTAVRAIVYRCGTGEPFVLYLERYTKEMQKKMTDARAKASDGKPVNISTDTTNYSSGREVKKPGDKDWVPFGSGPKFNNIVAPKCPDGSTDNLEIYPP